MRQRVGPLVLLLQRPFQLRGARSPRPASAGRPRRSPWPPAPSASRHRVAPPQDPAPAAPARSRSCCRDFRSSAAPLSAACFGLAGFLCSPSPPVPSASRHRVAPPQDPAPAARPAPVPVAGISQLRRAALRRLFQPGRLPRSLSPPVRSASRHHGAPPRDPAPAARPARCSCCRDFRSSAAPLSAACFSLAGFLSRLCGQRGLRLDITPCRREILLQPRGPLLFLLQGFPQLRRAAFRRLFQLGGFLARLACQCGLRLHIVAGRRKILHQAFRRIARQ